MTHAATDRERLQTLLDQLLDIRDRAIDASPRKRIRPKAVRVVARRLKLTAAPKRFRPFDHNSWQFWSHLPRFVRDVAGNAEVEALLDRIQRTGVDRLQVLIELLQIIEPIFETSERSIVAELIEDLEHVRLGVPPADYHPSAPRGLREPNLRIIARCKVLAALTSLQLSRGAEGIKRARQRVAVAFGRSVRAIEIWEQAVSRTSSTPPDQMLSFVPLGFDAHPDRYLDRSFIDMAVDVFHRVGQVPDSLEDAGALFQRLAAKRGGRKPKPQPAS